MDPLAARHQLSLFKQFYDSHMQYAAAAAAAAAGNNNKADNNNGEEQDSSSRYISEKK